MKAFYSDLFELPLPERHRFPMSKYRLLYEQVLENATQWGVELQPAAAATSLQLALVHDLEYVQRVFQGQLSEIEIRRIGFPWSPELVRRSCTSTGATVQAALAAIDEQTSVNLAGGTHHASSSRGQGFCVFNDVAVAIRVLQTKSKIVTAIVLDCDVHQGNGTAEIFAEDDSVFTCSLHGARNFPFSKTPSDLDIALPDNCQDETYLERLAHVLEESLALEAADIVFFVAGADPFQGDRLGRMSLSKKGLAARDRMVFDACSRAQTPVVTVMAGGYANNVSEIVEIHLATVQLASERAR